MTRQHVPVVLPTIPLFSSTASKNCPINKWDRLYPLHFLLCPQELAT